MKLYKKTSVRLHMVSTELKEKLEKQQYGIAGEHSAVKICTWTKKSLRGEGVCYKEAFYGISSHRCAQISPTVGFCQNNCIFCWRELELGEGTGMVQPSKTVKQIDDPETIIKESLKQHRKLLTGFGGNEKVDMKKYKEAQEPNQWAISLTGEPTLYPRLNELIKILKDRGNSVFVVSNGLLPDIIKNIEMPSQLYLSLDAPNKDLWKKIDVSLVKDGWERLNESLRALKELNKKGKTAVRITLIKEMNMVHPEQYAALLDMAESTYVEVKAYMFVGSSRQRLSMKNMPMHDEVKAFAEDICQHSSLYEVSDDKEESRVVLLTKTKKK
jgi:tRNA wybutosine-synthesizing protein 1